MSFALWAMTLLLSLKKGVISRILCSSVERPGNKERQSLRMPLDNTPVLSANSRIPDKDLYAQFDMQ